MSFQVGIVGATGKVGQTFLKLLEQENFPVKSLKLFASPANQGKTIYFKGTPFKIQTLSPHCFKDLDMVFFSAGENISREWAPQAVQDGAIAIDNSSAFRMDEQYPLVVPEINAHLLPLQSRKPTIIANPNCSTIQLVMALNPLKKFGLQSVKVATYQAVSGAGKEAQMELLQQTEQFLQAWKSSLQEPPEEVLSQKQNLLEHHHFPVPI
ncbi:MAG: aspartate-semialdehyde dehydrogenase, partial [Bdellovibrio sp.]